jgi:hypothetical protein
LSEPAHPAIRRGELEDPGPLMLNLGAMTPFGSLMGHLVYGLVLGLAYDAWPIAERLTCHCSRRAAGRRSRSVNRASGARI